MPMADWLGLRVTPEQQSIWEQECAGGMWSFVFRRGSVVGIFCAVLYCLEYAVGVSHQSWSLDEVAFMSLFFIVAGYVWALYVLADARQALWSCESKLNPADAEGRSFQAVRFHPFRKAGFTPKWTGFASTGRHNRDYRCLGTRPSDFVPIKRSMPLKVDEAGRTSISCSSLVWVQSNLGVPVAACLPDPLSLSSDDRNRLASRRRVKVQARKQPPAHPSGS
jgi:hypothetical protein